MKIRNYDPLLPLALAFGIVLLSSAANITSLKVFTLAFDYTDAAAVPTVDGFILYETTNIALPLDQWTPRLALSKTNWNLPAAGNQFKVTNTPGNYFWILASSNATWGVTPESFSNRLTNKPTAGRGAGFGVVSVSDP